MDTLFYIICVFLALWGITDIFWRIILWLTLESHNKHILIVPIDENDDPWFILRGLKHRASLCGLNRSDEIAVYDCGLDEKKRETCRTLCKNTGITFWDSNDIEVFNKNIYNKEQ